MAAVVRRSRVPVDSAMGLVLSVSFGLGLALLTVIQKRPSTAQAGLDTYLFGQAAALLRQDVVVTAVLGTVTVVVVAELWKELKLATVDAGLGAALGLSPAVVHYALMTTVSVTAVGAFSAVGSILVVALMIVPPATAYLLAERLAPMLWLSAAIAAAGALAGYWLAVALDVSIAGSMAVVAGALFAVAFLAAPRRGLLAQARRRTRQRLDFSLRMLVVHLLHHEGTPLAAVECRTADLHGHFRWSHAHTQRVVRAALTRALVEPADDRLALTGAGRDLAQGAVLGTPPEEV